MGLIFPPHDKEEELRRTWSRGTKINTKDLVAGLVCIGLFIVIIALI